MRRFSGRCIVPRCASVKSFLTIPTFAAPSFDEVKESILQFSDWSLQTTTQLTLPGLTVDVAQVGLDAVTGFPSLYFGVFLVGAFARFATLPLSLYGERAVSRLVAISPQIHDVYKKYLECVTHETVTKEDLQAALIRLWQRRQRLFRQYQTGNIRALVPPVTQFVLLSIIGWIQINEIVPKQAAALLNLPAADTLWWWGAYGIDPSCAIAATLTYVGLKASVERRTGFGLGKDVALRRFASSMRLVLAGVGCAALVTPMLPAALAVQVPMQLSSIAAPPAGAAAVVFLRILGPFWLGASCVGQLQWITAKYLPTRFKSRWFRWPSAVPASHGNYGDEYFAPHRHIEWEKILDTSQKKQETDYERSISIIEADCDRALRKTSYGRWLLQKMGEAPQKPREDLFIQQRPT